MLREWVQIGLLNMDAMSIWKNEQYKKLLVGIWSCTSDEASRVSDGPYTTGTFRKMLELTGTC